MGRKESMLALQPDVPWKMWGNTVRFSSPASPDPDVVATPIGQQLLRVDYKRPETWSFWIGAGLTGGNAALGTGLTVTVQVDIILGIGRSVFLTQQRGQGDPNDATDVSNRFGFAKFQWFVPAGTVPGQQGENWKYATAVRAPAMQDALPTDRELVDWIPAQSLQMQANFIKLATAAGQSVQAEVSAFVAPRTHVRPDWFHPTAPPPEMFRGGETGGS